MRWFDELQRMSTSPENAVASRIAPPGGRPRRRPPPDHRADADPAGHRRPLDDVRQRGRGRRRAIPGARLVALDSNNHILLAGEPAWATFVDEVTAFLEPDRAGVGGSPDRDRLDRVALAARARRPPGLRRRAGRTTRSRTALALSPRTVERHLSNVYLKLGLSGPAARAGAVARFLREG